MSVRTAGLKVAFPEACPVCGGRRLGKVGLDLYFCWDCCAQFNWDSQRLRVWEIADDGTLVPYAALASAAEAAASSKDALMESPAVGRVAGGRVRD